MKKILGKTTVVFLMIPLAVSLFICCQHQSEYEEINPEQVIADTVLAQVNTFYLFIKDTLQPAVITGKPSSEDLQQLFLKSRILFKKFEWAAEYFSGSITQLVNGPPVQEVENADLLDPSMIQAIDPAGLQVIEELLFPQYESIQKKTLLKQLDLLQSNCDVYEAYFTNNPLSDWRILDAVKLEVYRIVTLGITGYDNPLTLNSMNECAASLGSLKDVLGHYTRNDSDSDLIRQINNAINYLRENTDFDSFDRARFITDHGNIISSGIAELEQKLDLADIRYNRLLRQDASSLFDTAAFNVNAFAPGPQYYLTEEKVNLGKKLFFDPSLSGTGRRSCASCHMPDKAFTDGLAKNTSIHGKTPLDRSTPTLINAALQSNLFYDMRALTLEDQVLDVVHNKKEMDGSLQKAVEHISRNKTYRKLFSEAFPDKKHASIDTFEVMNAIASYVRSLTRLNSRFDEYMQGDKTALTLEELKGFNLFMGKAKCATCHFMPLFNGVTPPKYLVSETEVLGVPATITDTVIDPDLGWYNTIGIDSYKHAFKTPTVRNAARISSYMHNGIYETLEQVMEFYNNGGGLGMGINIKNQTLPEDSLYLTENEIHEVIAFMESLDSR